MRQAGTDTTDHERILVSTPLHPLDDLEWRGLIAHSTDLDALRAEMDAGPVRFYVGFDPTAPSLHMGNLLQILTARRLQEAGHGPYSSSAARRGSSGTPGTPASGR